MRAIFSIAGSILFFDQLTKVLAVWLLKPKSSIPVLANIFHLSFVENTGIAFGFFQGHQDLLTLVITLSIVGLTAGAWIIKKQSFSYQIAYGFILGGAIGNWIDRIRLQYVVDFLDFRVWPVFNVADSFITIGVILFIWHAIRGR